MSEPANGHLRIRNQVQNNVRRLLQEEGLSVIEKEMHELSLKYGSSKDSVTAINVEPKEFSRLETFGHDD